MSTPTQIALPPWRETADGKPRRVGVELEFSGLGIEANARHLKQHIGGSIDPISQYEYELSDTEFGTFRVELDFDYLKRAGREEHDDTGLLDLDSLPDELLGMVARRIVPFEIVTPPMPMDRLDALVPVIRALREAGARGTHHAPIYAFGLHMNPELPNLQAGTLLAYLQAFACLFPWLLARSKVDWTRRITPYIDRYGTDYVRHLLADDYAPDMDTLIDDYLRFNPTRNRALDMLPAFCEIDEPRVRAVVDSGLVKARPALHYRLPNCLIDEDGWNLDTPWHDWLQVEHLAANNEARRDMMRAFRDHMSDPISKLLDDWTKRTETWLVDLD